jgi:hypothetical protein
LIVTIRRSRWRLRVAVIRGLWRLWIAAGRLIRLNRRIILRVIEILWTLVVHICVRI